MSEKRGIFSDTPLPPKTPKSPPAAEKAILRRMRRSKPGASFKPAGFTDLASREVKVWGLVQRFSEDIDLVVDKAWLYASMARGTLRLVQEASRIEEWARDYTAMQQEMFYGDPPPWSEIIEVVASWERVFNGM